MVNKDYIEDRVLAEAEHIIRTKDHVRATAKVIGYCKSTVYNDMRYRLKEINPQMYSLVCRIIDYNKAQRHIRGGIATKRKYKG